MPKHPALPVEKKIALLCGRLKEHKAIQIVSLHIADRSSWAEALIIAGAQSARHARSLADDVLAWCREHGEEFLSMEGYRAGQWILVDLNDVTVNIFQAQTRELYRLESLWAKAPEADFPQDPPA
jgi:ribosome-associated protein